MEQCERRFAVLIDADNVSPKYIKYILDEVSDQGIATYKRIYGDWTDNEKRSWKNVLLDWSVNPIQQYSYTTGKNATDSAMIIDAMDILYSGNVDGFCLVSSDSDFTKLAQRLREAGMFVMGIGEQKTPKPFRAACDTFKLLEIISSDDAPEATVIENQKTITSIDEIQKAIAKLLIENNKMCIRDSQTLIAGQAFKCYGVDEVGCIPCHQYMHFYPLLDQQAGKNGNLICVNTCLLYTSRCV